MWGYDPSGLPVPPADLSINFPPTYITPPPAQAPAPWTGVGPVGSASSNSSSALKSTAPPPSGTINAVPFIDPTPGAPNGSLPSQVTHAYGFSALPSYNGAGETIAIIAAYNDVNIANDLATFDSAANLPAANLTVVNQTGGTTLPASDPTGGWQEETSLDVEWVHATAPGANILLVEANSQSIYSSGQPGDLVLAANYARNQPNVAVVSMSFGQN